MTADHDIRLETVASCLLCGKPGEELYKALPDRLFGAPGRWGFTRCPQCGLVWMSPRPTPEDLYKVYLTYFTHANTDSRTRLGIWRDRALNAISAAETGYQALAHGRGWKLLGRILSHLPPFRDAGRMGIMHLNVVKKGKLLDVGCGNGRFLAMMRDTGWDVAGVEVDPEGAKTAREQYRVPVITGALPDAAFPDETFDAVTLSHVIEHVYDPIELLKECRRVLKPGGKLIVITPNLASLAHRRFRQSWMALEPPRHLILFSPDTLRECAKRAGLHEDELRTSPRYARGIWTVSQVIKQKGVFSYADVTWRSKLGGLAFLAREELALRNSADMGEELVLIGSRVG